MCNACSAPAAPAACPAAATAPPWPASQEHNLMLLTGLPYLSMQSRNWRARNKRRLVKGKKENDWERTQTSLTCKAASVVWPRWVPRQEGGGEITVLVLALLVMFSEVCAHTEGFGHDNNWVISPHVVYAFHVVSSFPNSINIMLLGLLYTCTKIQRDK